VADETSDHEQLRANNQGQEERKGMTNTPPELQQSPR
jgi:hypothetical protein